MAGKPFYIYPQSFGPLGRRWEGSLLRWILGKARIVMVRESASMQLLQETLQFQHPRLYLLPDIAFAFHGAMVPAAESWLCDHGIDISSERPLLGLTTINWGAQNRNFFKQAEYENACAGAIRYFVSQLSGKVILFPQVTGPSENSDDRIPACRIISKLADISDSILLVEQQLSPDLIKTLYGQMDVFIGTRMHSNIFALSEGVPIIAIGYMHKTQGIAAMIGLDRWVLDIREIDQDILISKLAELWKERETLKAQIVRAIPALIEQTNQAGILCAEDFANFMKTTHHG
jgi:colanic acid/amylovoran biosynthesis protein